MNKLTAEKCRELIQRLNDKQAHPMKGLTGDEKLYLQALEIALPVLEQQERGESTGNLKHVGYLFVNSGGGVVYSPSGYGMRGFTCAGKIYGDVNLQQERERGEEE